MAYSLVDGASSHLFSFVFCCISMVENHHERTSLKLTDPASIEAPQASFHHMGVATNVYSRKMLQKPKKEGSADFESRGSGVVYV